MIVSKNPKMGLRRDGRVVEGGGLENRCPERDRGFESYSLRQILLRKIWRDLANLFYKLADPKGDLPEGS